jgi:hypothetical protein
MPKKIMSAIHSQVVPFHLIRRRRAQELVVVIGALKVG